MTTALTIPAQVEQALAFTATREKLIAMAADSARITAITNPASYQECHAARMALKSTRVEIEKTGKEARDDAVKFQKAVIAAEKELIGLIEPEEQRLKALQDAEDARKEAEKQAKARAEAERLAKQTAWFDAVKALPLDAMGKSVAEIEALIGRAEATSTDDLAEDMVAAGKFTIRNTVMALRAARDARMADDAEQARIAAEQEAERMRIAADRARLAEQEAELARMREEVERQRRAAEEAAAEVARRDAEEARQRAEAAAAERARQEAEAQRQREEQEAEERAAREAQEAADRAERERVAAEQKAEADRLTAERAKLEAEKRAAAKKAREQEIANATLFGAAADALALLQAEGYGDHLTTQKLAAALNRESVKAVA